MRPVNRHASDDRSMIRQLDASENYRSILVHISARYVIPLPIIAAVGSHESRWGLALKPPGPNGTGDFMPRRYPTKYRHGPLPPDGLGFGRGLMQIDFDYHEFARSGHWRHAEANIEYAVRLLNSFREVIKKKTGLNGSVLMRAVIASYNAGPGRILKSVREGSDLDYYTTGGNYSRDVLIRAEFFRAKGWS